VGREPGAQRKPRSVMGARGRLGTTARGPRKSSSPASFGSNQREPAARRSSSRQMAPSSEPRSSDGRPQLARSASSQAT
jgi:hypothetical protein